MTDTQALCPPHHWEVTTVRVDGNAFHHHRCVRCEAEKDVPISLATAPLPWKISGKRKASPPA